MTSSERQRARAAVDREVRARAAERREATDVMEVLMPSRGARLHSHCIYCGKRTFGRTCSAHRDLLNIELDGYAR